MPVNHKRNNVSCRAIQYTLSFLNPITHRITQPKEYTQLIANKEFIFLTKKKKKLLSPKSIYTQKRNFVTCLCTFALLGLAKTLDQTKEFNPLTFLACFSTSLLTIFLSGNPELSIQLICTHMFCFMVLEWLAIK